MRYSHGCRNADLGLDYHQHVFIRAMNNIVRWHSFWDPRILMNPLRPFVNWYNSRIVDKWTKKELQHRYDLLKERRYSCATKERGQADSIMDLAIAAYIDSHNGATPASLDPGFLRTATYQIRLFLFVGNDSTSSTIIFALHLLSRHPHIRAQVQAEHEDVFGLDPTATANMIVQNPSLLNKCKLTLAVIKETLRLYSPAATMRWGSPDCFLRTRKGVSIPTHNMAILVSHHSIHRNRRLWPRPDKFIPERWLVGPEHELYPQPGAWRAFEMGPRNCIGQTLSQTEMKVALAMTLRAFEIEPAYEDFDKAKIRGSGWSNKVWKALGMSSSSKPGLWHGDRAYQSEKAGAHPSESYPCHVKIRGD